MKKKILFALLSFTIAITNVPVVSYALEDSKQSITENGITSSKEAEKDLFEEETGSIYEKNADLSEEEMESQDVEADDSLTDESETIDGEKEDSFEDEKNEQSGDISSQQPEEPVIPEDEEDDTTDFGEAGFVEDEQGVRYYTEDGQIAVGEQIIDGFCYIFDENGVYIGKNIYNNSMIFIDRYNTKKYKNPNMVVFGMSGAGKSFYIKLLILRYGIQNISQYVIDPEREYENVCKALDGTMFKIGPNSNTYINVFDIREESIEKNEKGYLSNKINKSLLVLCLILSTSSLVISLDKYASFTPKS